MGPADPNSLTMEPAASSGQDAGRDAGSPSKGPDPLHDASGPTHDAHIGQPLFDAGMPDTSDTPDTSDVPDAADTHEGAVEGAETSTPQNDATAACPGGVQDLSNIGTADFHVSFRLTTSQTGWMALVNQRSACGKTTFWDIRTCSPGHDACTVPGGLFAETSGANGASQYSALYSTTAVADGQPHDVTVARIGGTLKIAVDGHPAGSGSSTASFGALPPLQVGTDPCIGNGTDPTVALGGNLSNLCITTP